MLASAVAEIRQSAPTTPGTERRYGPPDGWTPNARQAQFLNADDVEVLYGGPTRCGKTAALVLAALRFAHVPGYAALILRRTHAELKQPDGPAALALEWLGSLPGAKWNGTEMNFRLPCPGGGESLFQFGYLLDPQDHLRYQGGAYQFFGFDELTHFREAQYTWMFSRLSRRTSMAGVPVRFRCTANPGGPGHDWVKRRFGLHGIPQDAVRTPDGDDGSVRVFIPGRLEDNPGVDHATTRAGLRRISDPAVRRQLEDGDWDVVPGGAVFRAAPPTYRDVPEGLAIGIGVDFAYTVDKGDYSVAVVLGKRWVPDNGVAGHWRYYWLDTVRERVEAPAFAPRLKALKQRYPTALWRAYIGGTEKSNEAWLRASGVNVGAVFTGSQSKLKRALPVASAWNGREPDPDDPNDRGEPQRIWMPERGTWVHEAQAEVLSFTGEDGRGHDDVPDALSAAHDVLSGPALDLTLTTSNPRESAAYRQEAPSGFRGKWG